jgi:DNA sulfur modification protein DndD
MIFKSLTLHNLFSYYGTCTFDLMPPAGHAGNIVVIMGRNGFGKTSLLNSVKLLFGGVTKELRQSVQRGNSLSEKAFVLGAKEWWGILNHQAKNRREMNCYVQAILLNENNQEIVVRRSWNLQNDDHENQLEVTAPRKPPLTKDAAQQFLSGFLPLDYIPFFFLMLRILVIWPKPITIRLLKKWSNY